MVHVFTSASLCRAQPMVGRSPETSVELGLRLVSFGPKQQCACSHQLGLKRALTEAQVLQNSRFPQSYMTMYTLLQPHLVFPFPHSNQYNYVKRR